MNWVFFSAVVLASIFTECESGNWIVPCQVTPCSTSCGEGSRTVNFTICNSTGVNDTCDPNLQNLQTTACENVPCPETYTKVMKDFTCNKTNSDFMNFVPCYKNLNIDETILNVSIRLLTKWNADYFESRYNECNCNENLMNIMILDIEKDLTLYLSPTQVTVQSAISQVRNVVNCMPGVLVGKVWDVYDMLIEKSAILSNVDNELNNYIDFLRNAIQSCKGKVNPVDYIKRVIQTEL
ncbi:uncharacterized protein LOC100207118 isoform X1 [Hydra vulgaris]|uniref:uncharacterized protein LOC100207118 isoform X1 n=1 Tax=Hydra vulgaris TaxID=6087 RepID=UPI000192598D|nr:uncharacterized protein LOC100207118 [Hydra vulgaris]